MTAPDPVAFTVFNIDIMWYAILITSGMALAVLISCRRAPLHGLTSDQVMNFVIISIPAAIIGARLYYVIFNWSWYAGDFFRIINMRAGGLAIHGGLLFGFGAARPRDDQRALGFQIECRFHRIVFYFNCICNKRRTSAWSRGRRVVYFRIRLMVLAFSIVAISPFTSSFSSMRRKICN